MVAIDTGHEPEDLLLINMLGLRKFGLNSERPLPPLPTFPPAGLDGGRILLACSLLRLFAASTISEVVVVRPFFVACIVREWGWERLY